MDVTCAADFLQRWASHFTSEEVRNWVWTDEDDDFGKRTSWHVAGDPAVEAVATVELMYDQLQMTVTERDLATSSEDASSADAGVLFDALISFEDRSIVVDGEPLPWREESIADAIRLFGERS
ncbi:hypothetical protein [Burkholderia vietnamiensis]|uniref:hypothetical protein n=1 Tax=Burkholderia vietnamiensis TaxID=60552 RepID=UPI001ABA2BC4|nr:hypothetical protein [Burkholderia vietnamiensis]